MRDENKFILIPPEQIKNGRYIKNSDNNLTIKYYRHLHGGGETRWEEDGNDDNIENIKFKRGLYRVKFCYKLKDGTIYDEQEFIVGREISASVAKKKYPEVYEKYKDRNPRFVETPFGATIVRCAKCTLIAPEQLVESRFDPYKDKAYLNLE